MLKKLLNTLGIWKGENGGALAAPPKVESVLPPESPARVDELAHGAYRDILFELEGGGDQGKTIKGILLEREEKKSFLNRYDTLLYLLANHPTPHLVNYFLSLEEFKMKKEALDCYPTNVWMDISSVCSVECRFCKYVHRYIPPQNVSLAQIKSIEWMKYVRMLNLTAGTAEAITNPQFVEIFDYLRSSFPHLYLSFLTNGRTLNRKILAAIADRLDALHISMNASNEEDYNHAIAKGNWQAFSENLRQMKEIFRDARRPKVTASFVMMQWNVGRALECLDFAASHGASQILLHHYYPKYVHEIHSDHTDILAEKFEAQQSLYNHRQVADDTFAKVKERAKELGVEVIVPPPFSQEAQIYYGVRSLHEPPKDCLFPWTNMYMLWGWKSRKEELTICCGLASDIGVYFDRDRVATLEGLREVWNSPTLQAYRRTANGGRMNPICQKCRMIDRFDPESEHPDQKEFFRFNGLPIPEHFEEESPGLVKISSLKAASRVG